MQAGRLNERLIILRHSEDGEDSLGAPQETWAAAEPPEKIWAARDDVSDGEKVRAGATDATLRVRFTVYRGSVANSVTIKDRVAHDDAVFAIVGIKRADDPMFLEWTAEAGRRA